MRHRPQHDAIKGRITRLSVTQKRPNTFANADIIESLVYRMSCGLGANLRRTFLQSNCPRYILILLQNNTKIRLNKKQGPMTLQLFLAE